MVLGVVVVLVVEVVLEVVVEVVVVSVVVVDEVVVVVVVTGTGTSFRLVRGDGPPFAASAAVAVESLVSRPRLNQEGLRRLNWRMRSRWVWVSGLETRGGERIIGKMLATLVCLAREAGQVRS